MLKLGQVRAGGEFNSFSSKVIADGVCLFLLYADSFVNESTYCYGRLCVSVTLWITSKVWHKICSIYLVMAHKTDKKIHHLHFNFRLDM
jgi:hypothetical protein